MASLTSGLLLFLAQAWATCPAPSTYNTGTMPLQEDRALAFDCELANTAQCDDNIVVFPDGVTSGPVGLWLTGAGGTPKANRHVLNIMGFAGIRTLAPSWQTDLTAGGLCSPPVADTSDTGLLGGDCTTNAGCTAAVREEMTTGTDDPDTDFVPERLQSLNYRVGMLIDNEVVIDLVDGINDHDFQDLCYPHPDHGTELVWSDLVLAGHSAGGNHVTYLSYTRAVQGVFVADSGYDVCEAILPPYNPNNEGPFFAKIAWNSGDPYNSTGEPVSYYDEPDASYGKRVFAIHQRDIFPSVDYPSLPPSYTDHLLVDTASGDTGVSEYDMPGDTGNVGYAGQEVISTAQGSVCGMSSSPPHGSMAVDGCMPVAPGGSGAGAAINPTTSASSASLNLFEEYLEAFCSLL